MEEYKLPQWGRLKKPAGWAFRAGLSKAHFAQAEPFTMNSYVPVCGDFALVGPYEADAEFPKCSNCVRIIRTREEFRRVFEIETWAVYSGSTRKHFFKFENGIWKSACGVHRSREDFVDGKNVPFCKKCLNYLGKGSDEE